MSEGMYASLHQSSCPSFIHSFIHSSARSPEHREHQPQNGFLPVVALLLTEDMINLGIQPHE